METPVDLHSTFNYFRKEKLKMKPFVLDPIIPTPILSIPTEFYAIQKKDHYVITECLEVNLYQVFRHRGGHRAG